jgi:uncharacterized protein (DUF427 family)
MSMTKHRLTPGPDHPITIESTGQQVTIVAGDQVIAETDNALTLREASYPPIQYVPIGDVDRSALRSTDHQTYCPYKGDASYFTVTTPDGELENVIWTYEQPYEAVEEIGGHVAFYANRVNVQVGD